MKRLSKHLRVIAPCMRGYGYSSYNKPIQTLDDMVEDLELFVKHLKLDRFYLLGHSFGCVISM